MAFVELPQESVAELVIRMMKGDKTCRYQIGDIVQKTGSTESDLHKDGTPGIVVGNLVEENTPMGRVEAYLVNFEGDSEEALHFIAGHRLTEP